MSDVSSPGVCNYLLRSPACLFWNEGETHRLTYRGTGVQMFETHHLSALANVMYTGADKSLARPASRCHRTESIVSEANLLLRSNNTGLFKMIVGVLTTCNTQYTWDRSICIFLFNRITLKVFLHTLQVLYMCTLCDSTNINKIIEFVPNCL